MKYLVVIAVALAIFGVCDFAAVPDDSKVIPNDFEAIPIDFEVIPRDYDVEFLSTDSTVDVIPCDIVGELIPTGTEIELLPSYLEVSPGPRALEYASIAARNTLLTRIRLTVAAAANVVRVRDISFSSARTITAWRASEIAPSQGARAWLLSGGVGRTHVTVRYQSLVGRGLNVQLEVWGR